MHVSPSCCYFLLPDPIFCSVFCSHLSSIHTSRPAYNTRFTSINKRETWSFVHFNLYRFRQHTWKHKFTKRMLVNIPLTFFNFFNFVEWGETESTWYVGLYLSYCTSPGWVWSSRWNQNFRGKPKYSEKTCPSATLSTTNPTWPDLGSNPGHHGGKPATNRLSYGTACP
jgi:hypothetical protein